MRAVFEINKYTYMYIAYSNKIYVFNCHFSMSTQILKACINISFCVCVKHRFQSGGRLDSSLEKQREKY